MRYTLVTDNPYGMARCLVCRAVRRVEGRPGRHNGRAVVNWPTSPTTCCGRGMRVEQIVGRETDTLCDMRCTGAKGSNCDCACAGRNHGRDWA